MIKVERLVKKYGEHRAVDGLTFEIKEGKVYGLLGVNGAGKSTTMNILTGYIAPSAGTVTIGGYDIVKEAVKAKALIGYLPELPPLYPDMTVREYLCFAAELKRVKGSAVKEQLERVMQRTRLLEVSDRLIKNLSKGYKQRVGIAQALLGNPKVIILDEPTVGLDPMQIVEIRSLIRELGKEHTVILSSHILSEVQAVCDEIMIISKGHLVAMDTAANLENLMGGDAQLSVLIKGAESAVESALSDIAGIKNIKLEKEAEGFCRMSAAIDEAENVQEKLFYALAEKRLPVYEMNISHASLEEVFIELTNQAGSDEDSVNTEDTEIKAVQTDSKDISEEEK